MTDKRPSDKEIELLEDSLPEYDEFDEDISDKEFEEDDPLLEVDRENRQAIESKNREI